jgi:hypothetical protein
MNVTGVLVDASPRDVHKYVAYVATRREADDAAARPQQVHVVRFGLKSQRDARNDYPHHRNEERMKTYLQRHGATCAPRHLRGDHQLAARCNQSRKEHWERTGVLTPGFWSRWMLWSRRTAGEIARQLEKVIGAPVYLTAAARKSLVDDYTMTGA